MGTYVFYALVTSSAAGIFGASFLDIIGVWNDQPDWAGFVVGFVALALALLLAIVPAKRAAEVSAQRRGHHGGVDPRGDAGRPGQAAGRQRAGRRGVHDEGVLRRAGHQHVDPVPRDRLRPVVLRRLRGGLDARRGDRGPAARHPARDPLDRDLRRRLLHRRDRDRDDGVRPGRQGGRELHRLAGPGRRPRDVVHRVLGGQPDHARRLRLGVRLLPRLRGRGLSAAVRDHPGPGPRAPARAHRARTRRRRRRRSSCAARSS